MATCFQDIFPKTELMFRFGRALSRLKTKPVQPRRYVNQFHLLNYPIWDNIEHTLILVHDRIMLLLDLFQLRDHLGWKTWWLTIEKESKKLQNSSSKCAWRRWSSVAPCLTTRSWRLSGSAVPCHEKPKKRRPTKFSLRGSKTRFLEINPKQ